MLSVSELREHLAEKMDQVRTAPDPVFVGRHRRAEAVLLSADRYAELVAEERRAAVASAIGSVRAEGLDVSEYAEDLLREVADGTLTTDEVRARLLDHYRR